MKLIHRPDFLPPHGEERIDWTHPLAPGLRQLWIFRGWHIKEVVTGAQESYYGGYIPQDSGSGFRPSHTDLTAIFDEMASMAKASTWFLPHGQGAYNPTAGPWARHDLPTTELAKFLNIGKPWSWYWRGRLQSPSASRAVWGWGVLSTSTPTYRGMDCWWQTDRTLATHMIDEWGVTAKKLQFYQAYTPTIGIYNDTAVGFSYTGRPSGVGSTAEFAASLNGHPATLSYLDATGSLPWGTSLQPAAGTPLCIGSRQGGDSYMEQSEHRYLAFWDRYLSAEELGAIMTSGLPLI